MSAGAPGPRTEEVAGTSPWRGAWRRLARNRLAAASAGLVVLMAIAGYSAPWVAAHLTHFSLDEQHTRLAYAPPGTQDISRDHPTYDGDVSSFERADLDGDGVIACERISSQELVVPGLPYLARHAPGLAASVERKLAILDTRVPATSILRAVTGRLHCPDLEVARNLARHFDFLFDTYDRASGDDEPRDGVVAPDGYLTWREFPKDDGELKEAYRGHGLAGPDAFRALDSNQDAILEIGEVTDRSRHLRFDVNHLMGTHDRNHDNRLTADEYPGLPRLRTFYFGTDGKGRDVLTRLLYGARISITIGLLATLVSLIIGVIYGSIAGYAGGRTDNVMMRIVDVLYGLPFLFIVILLMVVMGRSTINLFIALGMVQWLSMARVIRGQVISLKTREFVEAARAIGVGRLGIVFRHLVPNSIGPVVVYATLLVPAVILEEAFLSFLGLGVQPPEPSWGNMITEGATKLEDYTWLILAPGAALATTLFAMNFVGDGIRDAIDAQMQGS